MTKTVVVAEGKVLGPIERVFFPEFEAIGQIDAKIDTGAYTGSLHCTEIRLEQSKDGQELHFSPFDHPEIEMKTKDFTSGPVRSSNGEEQDRFFINTTITIAGKTLPITLTLADRTEMMRAVLIGRRFLAEHGFLVDVTKRRQ
jgi:hypothetical protein